MIVFSTKTKTVFHVESCLLSRKTFLDDIHMINQNSIPEKYVKDSKSKYVGF